MRRLAHVGDFHFMGEVRKSIDMDEKALVIIRTIGDPHSEGIGLECYTIGMVLYS
jgi:hypothetical protein